MRVNISDLRTVSEKLFSHFEQNGHSSVEIPNDYYWIIPEVRRYDPVNEPADFSLGQLTEDWSRLQKIAEGENDPIGYGLVWLASILQAIGENNVS